MMRRSAIARTLLLFCAWAGVLLPGVCCRAQQDQKPVFTLKVYANVVQVPTLVLDHDKRPLPPIDFRRFLVSLDQGKKFAPTHVRMEGDDPLELAILLDVNGSQRHLIESFADAAEGMAAKSLHAQDHVSIYALNCSLIRSALLIPAVPGRVKGAVQRALSAPGLSTTKSGSKCGDHVYLWGAMVAVVKELSGSAGRPVVLVVSAGADSGSRVTWIDLHSYAAAAGVALFGMNDEYVDPESVWRSDKTDSFHSLCESTGGIVMQASARDLEKRLQQWIAMLRNRYVVEFPRPQQLGTGAHNIDVSIKKDGLAFVTLSGVSVSLPDPAVTSDPNYIPSQQGADIPVGNRRPPRN
ncbi:MAG TPA: hypothetical protein VFA99_05650 [Acidobacteriaceae bacterium]|nr:hypothetical protein [Acidobacteriaceae bacterium]